MLPKLPHYKNAIWPDLLEEVCETGRILLPGGMGSELFDRESSNEELWINLATWLKFDRLEFASLSTNGGTDRGDQEIFTRRTVRIPFVEDTYANFFNEVPCGKFPYDWRDSLPVAAAYLRRFLNELPADCEPIDFFTHSMGAPVLTWLLGETDDYDHLVGNIVYCAPAFRGALKLLSIIERGNGLPADFLFYNKRVKKVAASTPGLFHVLVAPEGVWPASVPDNGATVDLKYPVRGGLDLYEMGTLTNPYRPDLRAGLLLRAEAFHKELTERMKTTVERLGARINVIVGLNGESTAYAAVLKDNGKWRFHSPPDPDSEAQIANGDGMLLFQSCLLPGLPTNRYWAAIAGPKRKDLHGYLMDEPTVIEGVRRLTEGGTPNYLAPWPEFIGKIDWTYEREDGPDASDSQNLSFIERIDARQDTSVEDFAGDPFLDPLGAEAALSAAIDAAALRVLESSDADRGLARREARRLGIEVSLIYDRIRQILAPMLF